MWIAATILNDVGVANNSLIVKKSYMGVYCYSNSTSTNIGCYIFPDSVSQYSNSYHDYIIQRQTNSGVHLHSSYGANMWGIFTCEIPDSEGNTVETSIGIYSSEPCKLTRKISLYIILYIYPALCIILSFRCTICVH